MNIRPEGGCRLPKNDGRTHDPTWDRTDPSIKWDPTLGKVSTTNRTPGY